MNPIAATPDPAPLRPTPAAGNHLQIFACCALGAMTGWMAGILATETHQDPTGHLPASFLLSICALCGVAVPWLLRRRLSAWPVVPVSWLLINCVLAAFWTEITFPAMQFPPSSPPVHELNARGV